MAEFTLKLAKPIDTHKGPIETVTFREPCARDVIELGQPYRTIVGSNDTFEMRPEFEVVKRYAERLSGQSWADLGDLPVRELQRFQAWLNANFTGLGDDAGNSETPSAS